MNEKNGENQRPSQTRNPAYCPRKPDLPVHCMYFYHLTPTGDKAYLVDFGRVISRQKIEDEIVEAKRRIDKGEVTIGGYALGDIRWRRRSYFVVWYEDPHGTLKGCDAVVFKDMDDGDLHPFADGDDFEIGDATIFYCLNHMTSRGGNQPVPDHESEHFKLHVQHGKRGDRAFERRGHTDTGTNTGPPLQP